MHHAYHWMDSLKRIFLFNVRNAKNVCFAKSTILFFISCVRYAFKIVPISKDYQQMVTPISAILMGVAQVTSL